MAPILNTASSLTHLHFDSNPEDIAMKIQHWIRKFWARNRQQFPHYWRFWGKFIGHHPRSRGWHKLLTQTCATWQKWARILDIYFPSFNKVLEVNNLSFGSQIDVGLTHKVLLWSTMFTKMTAEFPAEGTSNTESFSMPWHHHAKSNPLRPSDAIRRPKSGSILPQVRACCADGTKPLPEPMLTYHQRCSESNFTSPHELNLQHLLGDYTFKITTTSPRVQWVKESMSWCICGGYG